MKVDIKKIRQPMNTKYTDSIQVVTLSKYTSPKIIEEKNKDFVSYGADNNYFQYLIDRLVGSTTNNAIIGGMVNMIYGKGLDSLDSRRKPDEFAQMIAMFRPVDVRRVISDRKTFGMAAMQITYEKGKVKSVTHFPMETLRAEKANKDGDIENWIYHPNWAEHKNNDKLTYIKSFGFGNKKGNEIFILKPYVSGYYYYSPVDYVGALPYALLEEEIADYLINDTLNGFSGTKVINFNNGVPDHEKQIEIKNDVLRKVTGTKGEKVIVAFNSNKENATTVEDLPLNDAPQHYQYLSDECRDKLLIAHKVTSPLLLGIRESGGGLGSNADEIKNSALFFDNIVIKSYQMELIEAFNEILSINGISLRLYFKTIQPLEFTDTDGMDKDTKEEETGVKMAKDNEGFDDDVMLESLEGSSVDDEWEIVEKREYSEDAESVEDWANRLIKPKKDMLTKLADFIKSKPSGDSTLDKSIYKVRYEYAEISGTDRSKSRVFCKKMMARTEKGVVYRKEDIDQASFQGVNKSFGHKGQNYSLWLYAGGKYCHHFWNENLYRLKKKTDGTYVDDKALSSSEELDNISGYKPNPKGWDIAKTAPITRSGRGEYPY